MVMIYYLIYYVVTMWNGAMSLGHHSALVARR